MSRTEINIAEVLGAVGKSQSAKTIVRSNKDLINGIRYSLDGKIQNRANIRNRLCSVQDRLGDIECQIGRINTLVQSGVDRYRLADEKVSSYGRSAVKSIVSAKTARGTINWANQFLNSGLAEPIMSYASKMTSGIGECIKCDETIVVSSVIGYLGTLLKTMKPGAISGVNVASNFLLTKPPVKVETGVKVGEHLFDHYMQRIHPYEAVKLDAKYGKTISGLAIASDVFETAKAAFSLYKTHNDPEATAYDRAAKAIKIGDPLLQLGGTVYTTATCSTKTLQFVSTAGKAGKPINQILDTPQLQYTTSAAVAQKVKNVNAGVTIGAAYISGFSSAVREYGEVKADGSIDMGDVGAIGMNFGLSGLSSMANSLTFGIVDIDAEKAADHLQADADRFAQGDSWAAQYMRDQDNNIVLRFGVSIGSAAYILGENAVEGVGNGAKAAASWISNAWNQVF